jgi:hypothetical protein
MTLGLWEFFWDSPSWTLYGLSPVTFSQTGDLKGAGALASSTTIVFDQTGDLKGAGALLGSNGFVFNETGDLKATGLLAGTTAVLLSQTGAILGAGALTGTVPLVFTLTGTALAPDALLGTSTLIFAVSGSITNLPLSLPDTIWVNADGLVVQFGASVVTKLPDSVRDSLEGATGILFYDKTRPRRLYR